MVQAQVNFCRKCPIRMKKLPLILVVGIIALAFVVYESRSDNNMHVYFLDVGQGDSVLIKRGQIEILIDGGPSPGKLTNELGKLLPLWDRNIELVVLTHPHEDHLAGLVEFIKRYEVGSVMETETSPNSAEGTEYNVGLYSEWQELISKNGIRVIDARAQQMIELNGIEIDILNPKPVYISGTSSDTDNNSIVLDVIFGDLSFLLTSDIYSSGESRMLSSRLVPDCSVLKVAHHGSNSSTSQEFLNVSKPEVAVVSVGENNYGQPAGEVLNRLAGCKLYQTDESGTIEFITNGSSLWVRTAR